MRLHIKSRLRRVLRPPLYMASICRPHVFLGTDYGGWPLLRNTPRGALIYSFGVGEDISFDLGAIKWFGCKVHAFDPTPKSKSWVGQQSLPSDYIFHPEGVAAEDGEAKFAPPTNERHVSFSSTRACSQNSVNVIIAPVRRVLTFIERLGTDVPCIIKMDVEGFEYTDRLYALWSSDYNQTTGQGLVTRRVLEHVLPTFKEHREYVYCPGGNPKAMANWLSACLRLSFNPYDVEALSALMVRVASDDCDRVAMGHASWEIISRWTPQIFADGLTKAVETASGLPRPRAGLLDKLLVELLMRR